MTVQNDSFAEAGLQQLPEEVAQLAYRLHPQPGRGQFTSLAQNYVEENVFGPSAPAGFVAGSAN